MSPGKSMWSVSSVEHLLIVGAALADVVAVILTISSLVKQDLIIIVLTILLGITSFVVIYKLILPRIRIRIVVPLLVIIIISVLIGVYLWSTLASSNLKSIDVTITSPKENEIVPMAYLVQGTVSDPNSRVYVMVHPLTVPKLWVQNSVVVGADGKWQIQVLFGTEDQGKSDSYELVAIATHENFLITLATGNYWWPGAVVDNLPQNTNRSNVVTVFRSA